MSELDNKINRIFEGCVVRKDLVKEVRGNVIVPSYVLEYLLGQYCATNEENAINEGIETVKQILAKHYVHRNESELVKSNIKEKGSFNGICIDIGGIMPAVDFSKLQEISQAKKAGATLSLRNVFECIEKARKSIIIGDKPATRFLKRCKELSLQHFNTGKILNNTEYLGLFKQRKDDIISEIINKKLLS